jgi:hypothetical protein
MEQMDIFEETLEKKIFRMERWISRLQKEMWFLKEVYQLTRKTPRLIDIKSVEQVDMFGG